MGVKLLHAAAAEAGRWATRDLFRQAGKCQSNSNKLIFPFSLFHHIGKSPFSISTYMKEVLQQIDFPPFYMEREIRCLPFLLGIGKKLLGIEKK